MTTDIELSCDVCGGHFDASDVEPVVAEGMMRTFWELHSHSEAELKIYHESALAADNYRWSNPHTHGEDDG